MGLGLADHVMLFVVYVLTSLAGVTTWSSGAGRSKQTWHSEVTSSENLKKTHSLGWWTRILFLNGIHFRPGRGGGDNEPGFLMFSVSLLISCLNALLKNHVFDKRAKIGMP